MIKIPKAELFAKISFIILIFFTFFPTGLPFQSTLQEQGAEEIGQSNILNQIIRLSIFILSFIAFLPKSREVFDFIFKEKIFALFLLWALITISWSNYPSVSFKRWFQVFTIYLSTIVYLTHYQRTENVLSIIKPIVIIYIISTILVLLTIPAAKDPRFYTWRGFSPHKNHLGQMALILILSLNIIIKGEKNNLKKYILILFLVLAVVILFGAFSSTSILAFLIFLSYSLIFYFNKQINYFFPLSKSLNIIFISASIVLIAIFYLSAKEFLDELGLFGKDFTTLSDRTYLWEYMLLEVSKHPLLGTGFRGFWVVENPIVQSLWSVFQFLPIQSHNGYIDLTNETGIIGLFLLMILVVLYYIRTYNEPKIWKWSWFITLTIFINISESTLFREGHSTFIFFTIAYLVSFNIYNQKWKINSNDNSMALLDK